MSKEFQLYSHVYLIMFLLYSIYVWNIYRFQTYIVTFILISQLQQYGINIFFMYLCSKFAPLKHFFYYTRLFCIQHFSYWLGDIIQHFSYWLGISFDITCLTCYKKSRAGAATRCVVSFSRISRTLCVLIEWRLRWKLLIRHITEASMPIKIIYGASAALKYWRNEWCRHNKILQQCWYSKTLLMQNHDIFSGQWTRNGTGK